MSREAFEKIAAGIRDAIAFCGGDTSRAHLVRKAEQAFRVPEGRKHPFGIDP